MLILTLSLALSSSLYLPQEPAPKPGSQLVEVTYLANAGFLIRSGSNSILIDAFVPREVAGLEALNGPLRKALTTATAPFDGPTLSLISHAHPDHFRGPFGQLTLLANPKAKLISSQEVVTELSRAGKGWEEIRDRVGFIRRDEHNRPLPFNDQENDMSILFLDLPHSEGVKEEIVHLGHLVRLGNFKFLHLGDAAPSFSALSKYKLAERDIDLVFVPYWFYASEEGTKAIDEAIHARFVVVYHMPLKEKSKFKEQLKLDNPGVIVFGESMERKMFEASGQK